MGAFSRNKGAVFERQVTNDLKRAGFDARKVPLSGADVNHPGDVEIVFPDGSKWLLQCKISADSGGRKKILKMMRQVVIGRVVIAGDRYLVMRRPQFIEALGGARPRVLNMPEIAINGRMVLQHIAGHDALIFRTDGLTEWCAMVDERKFG